MSTYIKQIRCVGSRCLIETDKGLYGFGCNVNGGLGNGNKTNQYNPILLNAYFK